MRERPPEEGARLLALSFLDQAAEARARLADSADTEALHDFRVGLRRLRSCLRAYSDYLGDSIPKKLARKLRRLTHSTGPGRDVEVQIEWLRERRSQLAPIHRAGLSWLLAWLERRRREAESEMQSEIERDLPEIEEELRRRLSVYHVEIHLAEAEPRETLAGATAAILRRQVKEFADHLSRIEEAGDERPGHEARISAKRVRYLIEPFAEEVPEILSVVKRLKALQDLLGELHDAHVLESELAEALETAAIERSRTLLEVSLAETPDEKLLRTERRRPREWGVIALARLNRARRDELFAALKAEWLGGEAKDFLDEVDRVGEAMTA